MMRMSWKLIGCLAFAGLLMLPLDAQAKGHKGGKSAKAGKAGKAGKAAKGTVVLTDLAQAVQDAINKADTAATVKKVVQVQGTKKHAGETLFVAHLTKGTQRGKIVVSSTGTVIHPLKWHEPKAKTGKAGKGHKNK